ncbi:MAG: hypothetical protein KA123_02110 [Candidatus Eisenbacteria bacterium]|nr:hypothetical protein [Candidatus Eisenbacteria bacterium]
MSDDSAAARYHESAEEAARALDLPLFGVLAPQTRFFPSGEATLASLAPAPVFSARIYRFLAAPAPVIWVLGLGQAGEELPVALGIAERAAAGGASPILIVRPGERRATEPAGSPVHAGILGPELRALLPERPVAEATGIQGVFLGCAPGRAAGDALEAGGIIIAGETPGEPPPLPPAQVTSLVLVVPFRDCPASLLAARVAELRVEGYAIAGIVAYGRQEGAFEEASGAFAGAQGSRGASPGGEEATPGATGRATGGSAWPSSVAKAVEARVQAPSLPVEQVEVVGSWSARFGPGSDGARTAPPNERRGSLPLYWWLVIAIAALTLTGILFPRLAYKSEAPARTSFDARPELQARTNAQPQEETPAPAHSAAQQEPAAQSDARRDSAGRPDSDAERESLARTDPAAGGSALPGASDLRNAATAAADSTGGAPRDPMTSLTGRVASIEREGAIARGAIADRERRVDARSQAAGDTLSRGTRTIVSSRAGPFGLLCGSFPNDPLAAVEMKRLAGRGIEARIVQVEIPGRGLFSRVVIGRYASVDEAIAAGTAIVENEDADATQVVAADGYGPLVSRPIVSGAP